MNSKFNSIIDIIDFQIYEIRRKGLEPNRVILGIKIFNYLESHMHYYEIYREPYYEYHAVIMGLPITVDTTNKNLISVSCGTEVEYDLESDKEKFMDVLQWQRT